MGRPVERVKITWGMRLFKAACSFGWVKQMPMGGTEPITMADVLLSVGIEDSPIESWHDADLVVSMCRAFSRGLEDGKTPLSIPPWER